MRDFATNIRDCKPENFEPSKIGKDFRKLQHTSGSLEGLSEVTAHLRESTTIVAIPGQPLTKVEGLKRISYIRDDIRQMF